MSARIKCGPSPCSPHPWCPSMSRPTTPVAAFRLHTLDRQPVQWLVPGWLARGALALLDGDPGLGKSTLAAELAARLSRGDGQQPPASVLILSAEDDPARVIRPRLEAAGADLQRILLLESVGPEERPVQLPEDCDTLGQLIEDEHIG